MILLVEKIYLKTRASGISSNHIIYSTELKKANSTRNSDIPDSELITDINGNTFLFTDIVEGKTIYFRFSESGCRPCISEQVKFLKLINQSGLYRVVILVNCKTLRNLQILINSHEISDFEIYKLDNEEDWGAHGVSYYFTLDENCLSPENVFVVSPNRPEASIDYFKKALLETISISFNN